MDDNTTTTWMHSPEYGWGIRSEQDPAVVFVYDAVTRVWAAVPAETFTVREEVAV